MKKTKEGNNFPRATGRAAAARPPLFSFSTLYTLHSTPFAGFTLVEMVVSVALFSFVMLATISVLLNVVDANHKAQGLKTSINNLSLTLESMARNLRTGSNYSAGVPGCNDNGQGGSPSIFFTDHNGDTTAYLMPTGGASIQISKNGVISDMTAPEITIDRLCFYVNGTKSKDNTQPSVFITAGGVVSTLTVAGAKEKTKSRFDIQTMVSQRLPDVATN